MQRLRLFIRVLSACVATPLLAIAVLAITSAAIAADETNVTVRWAPATGPVEAYAVFVSRNGQEFAIVPDHVVNETQVTLQGAVGDTLVVRVAARDKHGNQGPFSPDSDPIRVGEPSIQLPALASAPVPDAN